ncbi:hypothetical protein PIB19_16670 [Sphingomonas sp. 7/4-4]|uniref:hypothetical protein n=1 Tax=Sphingomonas sp. 7/4-4 TaxID=3018446 RepID=UPI0022F39FBE|nr:hypothetical protein [Sphingomonas sp. 7/4-4]WBY07056.1 hypothetical protein PIB19_16670 [Sphingomonas sp. 7/4-4]
MRFSAPIPRAQAEAIRITLPDGKALTPIFSDEEKRKAVIADVKFKAPLPAAVTAKLTLPANVADESGRKLSNAERFPLDVRFDEAPPLVKFAADFGILEAAEGGVLPVTVRNVEPQLVGKQMAVGGQSLRVEGATGRSPSGCGRSTTPRKPRARRRSTATRRSGSISPAASRCSRPPRASRSRSRCPARARSSKSSASR